MDQPLPEATATTTAPWHALPVDDALSQLRSAPTGLSPDDAAQRLAAHGPNRLAGAARPGAWRRLLGQFHNLPSHRNREGALQRIDGSFGKLRPTK